MRALSPGGAEEWFREYLHVLFRLCGTLTHTPINPDTSVGAIVGRPYGTIDDSNSLVIAEAGVPYGEALYHGTPSCGVSGFPLEFAYSSPRKNRTPGSGVNPSFAPNQTGLPRGLVDRS
jgi:hypothetical protein